MDAFWEKYSPRTDYDAIKLIKKQVKKAAHLEKEGEDPYSCLKEAHDMITDFFTEHGLAVETGLVTVLPATVK